jgi:hypothetical protein
MVTKIRDWFGGYGGLARIGAIGLLGYFLVWESSGSDDHALYVVAFIFFAWACMPIRRFKRNVLRAVMEPTYGMPENEDYLIDRPVVCVIFGMATLLLAFPENRIAALFAFAIGCFCAGTRFDDRQLLRRQFLETLVLEAAPEPNRAELAKAIRRVYSLLSKLIDEWPNRVKRVLERSLLEARCHELLKTHTQVSSVS